MTSLPTRSFEALLSSEELEERVEFVDWTAGASAECSSDGCSGTVSVSGSF